MPDEQKEATFIIHVKQRDDGSMEVAIGSKDKEKKPPFLFWMSAAEYLIAVTAMQSNAGFEKAIELLTKGALTYKTIFKKESPKTE